MITFYTSNGRKWSCPRHDHDHSERGGNVPCSACWPIAQSFISEDDDRGAHAGYALRATAAVGDHRSSTRRT